MAALEDMLPDILAETLGCPQPLALRVIRTVVRDFCTETEAWKYTSKTSAIANIPEIDLDKPNDSVVMKIEALRLEAGPLSRSSRAQLNYDIPDWGSKPGVPQRFFLEGGQAFIAPIPDKNYIYVVEVDMILKPSLSAETVGDSVFEQYYETILNGCLGKLFGMKGAEWFNRTEAEKKSGLYYAALPGVKAHARSDDGNRNLVTTYGGL